MAEPAGLMRTGGPPAAAALAAGPCAGCPLAASGEPCEECRKDGISG